ncbi:MAG: hypothetical protein KH268_12505 [Clostridiales bacterium]|nr:hypothetical protein [Clostridiales bacterium]
MRKHFKTFLFAALTCSLLLGAGLSTEAASKIRIDDTNFAWAVKEYAVEADTNDDGYLSKKEAAKIKKMRFFEPGQDIDSFKGIEYFPNLEDFYYRAEYATFDYEDINIYTASTASELDLSGLTKLKRVRIDSRNPYLRKVNLKKCTSLEEVTINGSRYGCIDTLNLQGCSRLHTLSIWGIDAKKLNLSGLKKLEELNIDAEKLKVLNMKNCSGLKKATILSGADLKKVNVKGDKKLEYLRIAADCYLKSLDLRTNTNLEVLVLHSGLKVDSLDVRKNKKLRKLACYETKITSLDLSYDNNIVKVDCHLNEDLTELDVSGCKKLKTLHCHQTGLTRLNLRKNPDLRYLRCADTGLLKLNLKKNKKLEMLNCLGTDIRSLDLSNTRMKDGSKLHCDEGVKVTFAR